MALASYFSTDIQTIDFLRKHKSFNEVHAHYALLCRACLNSGSDHDFFETSSATSVRLSQARTDVSAETRVNETDTNMRRRFRHLHANTRSLPPELLAVVAQEMRIDGGFPNIDDEQSKGGVLTKEMETEPSLLQHRHRELGGAAGLAARQALEMSGAKPMSTSVLSSSDPDGHSVLLPSVPSTTTLCASFTPSTPAFAPLPPKPLAPTPRTRDNQDGRSVNILASKATSCGSFDDDKTGCRREIEKLDSIKSVDAPLTYSSHSPPNDACVYDQRSSHGDRSAALKAETTPSPTTMTPPSSISAVYAATTTGRRESSITPTPNCIHSNKIVNPVSHVMSASLTNLNDDRHQTASPIPSTTRRSSFRSHTSPGSSLRNLAAHFMWSLFGSSRHVASEPPEVKGLFNVSTTSTRSPSEVREEIVTVLKRRGASVSISGFRVRGTVAVIKNGSEKRISESICSSGNNIGRGVDIPALPSTSADDGLFNTASGCNTVTSSPASLFFDPKNLVEISKTMKDTAMSTAQSASALVSHPSSLDNIQCQTSSAEPPQVLSSSSSFKTSPLFIRVGHQDSDGNSGGDQKTERVHRRSSFNRIREEDARHGSASQISLSHSRAHLTASPITAAFPSTLPSSPPHALPAKAPITSPSFPSSPPTPTPSKKSKHAASNCSSIETVIIDLEVCSVRRVHLTGIRLKRIKGDIWLYHKECQSLLAALRL